jgi:hypothetical protein
MFAPALPGASVLVTIVEFAANVASAASFPRRD